MAEAAFFEVSIAEAVILLGIIALILDRLLDLFGKTRSSKLLRIENDDLIRRLAALEASEARCLAEVDRLNRRVVDLEAALETINTLRRRLE